MKIEYAKYRNILEINMPRCVRMWLRKTYSKLYERASNFVSFVLFRVRQYNETKFHGVGDFHSAFVS